MGPGTATVRYSAAGGAGRVEVDGQDVTGLLQRFSLDHEGYGPPKVFLTLSPRAEVGDIECEAVVHVVVERPADELEAVRGWLEPLDGGEFEKAVLAAMELGGPQTFGEAALAVLRGWVTPRGD